MVVCRKMGKLMNSLYLLIKLRSVLSSRYLQKKKSTHKNGFQTQPYSARLHSLSGVLLQVQGDAGAAAEGGTCRCY